MNTSIEALRADVKFALTKQPGESCAAIDGDAYTVVPLSFFARKVPPLWLDEIHENLLREHTVDTGYDKEGKPTNVLKGVATLEFHQWVHYKVVKTVDPNFHIPYYHGRGRTARSILEALAKWVEAGE